jgi:hypothetical protein
VSPKNKKKKAATQKAVNPVTAMKRKALETAAIVSQVLVHFGAGYGPVGGQIFASPADAAKFSNRLMKATMKNLKQLNWGADQGTRDGICGIAFKHGGLAKAEAAGNPLTWPMIEKTLNEVKKACPPGRAGGGLVCTE